MKNLIVITATLALALTACGGDKKKDGKGGGDIVAAINDMTKNIEAAKGDCAKVAKALEDGYKKHESTIEAFNKKMQAKKDELKKKYTKPEDFGKMLEEVLKVMPPGMKEADQNMKKAVGQCRKDPKVREMRRKIRGKGNRKK